MWRPTVFQEDALVPRSPSALIQTNNKRVLAYCEDRAPSPPFILSRLRQRIGEWLRGHCLHSGQLLIPCFPHPVAVQQDLVLFFIPRWLPFCSFQVRRDKVLQSRDEFTTDIFGLAPTKVATMPLLIEHQKDYWRFESVRSFPPHCPIKDLC